VFLGQLDDSMSKSHVFLACPVTNPCGEKRILVPRSRKTLIEGDEQSLFLLGRNYIRELNNPKSVWPISSVVTPAHEHVAARTVVIEVAPVKLEFDADQFAASSDGAIRKRCLNPFNNQGLVEFIQIVDERTEEAHNFLLGLWNMKEARFLLRHGRCAAPVIVNA
jgi:hypothetical protein